MALNKRMKDYLEPRTYAHIDALYALKHHLPHPPVEVEISPTSSCNQKCRYCYTYNRDGKATLEKDHYIDIVRQAADYGVKSLLIQGTGEPLVNKWTPDAIEAAAARGLDITLSSNGALFVPEIQDRVLEKLFYIRFSVMDSDPARYAVDHGCDQSQWHDVVSNISYAANLRDKNDLDVVLWSSLYASEDNLGNIVPITGFLKNLGLDYIYIYEPAYTEFSPDGRSEFISNQITAEKVEQMRKECESLMDENFHVFVFRKTGTTYFSENNRLGNWKKNNCTGIDLFTSISATSHVYSCWRFWGKTDYSYGNLKEQTFKEIWEGEKRQKIREYIFKTPPEDDGCVVCGHCNISQFIANVLTTKNKWKNILY